MASSEGFCLSEAGKPKALSAKEREGIGRKGSLAVTYFHT